MLEGFYYVRPTKGLHFMKKPKGHNTHQGIRNVPMTGAPTLLRSSVVALCSLTPVGMMEL